MERELLNKILAGYAARDITAIEQDVPAPGKACRDFREPDLEFVQVAFGENGRAEIERAFAAVLDDMDRR